MPIFNIRFEFDKDDVPVRDDFNLQIEARTFREAVYRALAFDLENTQDDALVFHLKGVDIDDRARDGELNDHDGNPLATVRAV